MRGGMYERVSSFSFHGLKLRGCTRALLPVVKTWAMWKNHRIFSRFRSLLITNPVARPSLIVDSCREICESRVETRFYLFGVIDWLLEYGSLCIYEKFAQYIKNDQSNIVYRIVNNEKKISIMINFHFLEITIRSS